MLLQISTLIHVALNFYSPSTAALIYWVWIYTLHKHTIKQTFIMLWSLWHTGNNTINNVALHSEFCCLFCLCCCFKSNSYNHLFIFFTFLFLCVCRCLCVCVCVCESSLCMHAWDWQGSTYTCAPRSLYLCTPTPFAQICTCDSRPAAPPRQGANCSVTSTRLPARTQCTVMVGSRKRCSLASSFVYIFFFLSLFCLVQPGTFVVVIIL